MSNDEPWTIKRLLDWTTDHFKKSDPDNPRLRAEVLLAEALDCQRIELYTRFDSIPEGEPLLKFRDWVKRHAKGEPVAYLVGHREFYSIRFAVNAHVLIPRPETEHLIMAAIEACKKFDSEPTRIADIGTGSGCIAITMALQVPGCEVVATDISQEALKIAQENAIALEANDRISFREGDLLSALNGEPFDLIVSNPPYIGTDEQGTVESSVQNYEPTIALFSGADGMTAIHQLVAGAANHLKEHGFFIFEISPFIADQCRTVIDQTDSLTLVEIVKDYSGHERIVVARRS